MNKKEVMKGIEKQIKEKIKKDKDTKRFVNELEEAKIEKPFGVRKPELESGGFGTAALVCGIGGLVLFPPVLSTLAIIFGAMGMSRNQKYGTAGMWLGIVGLVGWVLLVLFVSAAFLSAIASI